MNNIKYIANKFRVVGDVISIEPYGNGLINGTYLRTIISGLFQLEKFNLGFFFFFFKHLAAPSLSCNMWTLSYGM